MMKVKALNEDKLKDIEKSINYIKEGFLSQAFSNKMGQNSSVLYHYTSFEKLFAILDGDSFWASRSRFSNDSTENLLLGEEWIDLNQYYGDNYMVCFCQDGDILSQWRGYCSEGGASIGFKFQKEHIYTILHADYDPKLTSSINKVELYKNSVIPVIYCNPIESSTNLGVDIKENLFKLFEDNAENTSGQSLVNVAPYLKNSLFKEEQEYRLNFDNSDGLLEKCVRFRTLKDGSMIPYMVVKYGDYASSSYCLSHTYTKERINNIIDEHLSMPHRPPIIIPSGRDQSDICREFSKALNNHKIEMKQKSIKRYKKWLQNPLDIICDGHLPIVSITVSPSHKQDYMREVIERFCRSRYWLQNVEVKCSKIPYLSPQI